MINQTTIRLAISRPALIVARGRSYLAQRDPLATLAVPVLLLVIMIAIARQLLIAPSPTRATPTPALPIIMIATAPAAIPPTALPIQAQAVLPHTLARAVVAYDAPEGHVIGAIDSGHAYAVVARYGVAWIQADVRGSGLVWLRADEVFDLPRDLSDLAPTAQIERITVYVSAPAAPAPAPDPPAEALEGQPIVMDAAQQAAVDREFGLTPAEMDAALAAHQAREAAWAAGQTSAPPTGDHIPTSAEMPCHCP